MSQSTYEQPLPKARHAQAATGHTIAPKPYVGRWHTYPEMAAAGLWTTPSDLARYVMTVQRMHAGEAEGPLSQNMPNEMLTPQNGGPVGLGPQIAQRGDTRRFRHGGSNEGYQCVFIADVEGGQGAVVMTNSNAGSSLAVEILGAIAVAYQWPDYLQPEREAIALADDELDRYVGPYTLSGTFGAVVITRRGNRLFAQPTLQPELELFFESPTRFFTDDPEIQGTFQADDEGAVRQIEVEVGQQRITAVKKSK
jgi:hypothetical protein